MRMLWKGLHTDYHPAVVKVVNVDEDYVEVIDVSDNNKEKKYEGLHQGFRTESDLLGKGFSKEDIDAEYKKYWEVVRRVVKKLI